MKAAIFSCKGLGDGLISIALANNLFLNSFIVDLFHINLDEIQEFLPNFNIKKYPSIDQIENVLSTYDKIFVSFDDSNIFVNELIKVGKKKYQNKLYVLNPSSNKKMGSQPFYQDAKFDPNCSMVDNIDLFCRNILKLENVSKIINFSIPCDLQLKKYHKRVIIHPSSAKDSKNYPIEKYMQIATELKSLNFDPVFVMHLNEKNIYENILKNNFILKTFDNLKELFSFVYESSFMIGNDSGIGHLASIIGLPTVSIFRNHRIAKLWHPGWGQNLSIYPSRFICNFSFYRLRDKKWKKFITVKKILKTFLSLNVK